MKKIKFLLLGAIVLFAYALNAQTVDEIIDRHIEALGGKEKLSQIKSLYKESSFESMGRVSSVKEYVVEGKGFKSESEINGSKVIKCYTDKSGWSVNPGSTVAQAMPDDIYKAGKDNIFIAVSYLVGYAVKSNKVEFIGKEGNDYKLKVSKEGAEIFYFIDVETNLVSKTTQKGPEVMGESTEIVVTFSDYKKTDFGIVIPYIKTIDVGGFGSVITVTKLEVNKEIDLKTFEMSK